MIYSVIPEEMADELYERLSAYYADDENVRVIIDRRRSSRRGPAERKSDSRREVRDRRRARAVGDLPDIPAATGDDD